MMEYTISTIGYTPINKNKMIKVRGLLSGWY